jgi:thiol-disulfide isomerase/thioredoxin
MYFYRMKYLLLAALILTTYTGIAQDLPKWKITHVDKYISENDGVLVINMWATFCKPCVAEIPGFIKAVEDHKNENVKLLLISLDLPSFYPKKIAAFAKKHNFTAPMAWLDETNADYFCPKIDKSWSGSIPATLFLNTKTGYRKFVEEEMSESVFRKNLQAAIKGQ